VSRASRVLAGGLRVWRSELDVLSTASSMILMHLRGPCWHDLPECQVLLIFARFVLSVLYPPRALADIPRNIEETNAGPLITIDVLAMTWIVEITSHSRTAP
jgi:hypothetical protein